MIVASRFSPIRIARFVSPQAGPARSLESTQNIRVLQLFTVDQSLIFIRGQIDFLVKAGVDVTVACAAGPLLDDLARTGVNTQAVAFEREWSPRADLRAIGQLMRLIRRTQIDIVHASTPKAGLIAMLAARLVRTSSPIYHMRGLPYLSESGVRRKLLRTVEWLTCSMAARVICVSESLRDRVVRDRVVAPEKVVVLGSGSGNGVDVAGRFNPDLIPEDVRIRWRDQLRIPHGAFVFAFIGRFARAKGLAELHSAWESLSDTLSNAHLLLVGELDSREPFSRMAAFRHLPNIHVLNHIADIQEIYATVDVVVLPTYREGLPNVLMEAGAMRRAVIASETVGCVDVVEHERTGLLVPVGDSTALARAMATYYDAPHRASQHGAAARAHVTERFDRERVWAALLEFYRAHAIRARRERSA